jgi:hypothetical protein
MSDEDDDEPQNQLWVMIKIDEFFRSEIHSQIEDELIELMVSQNLGVSDGHSSGAHQFDVNFYDVQDFEKAKAAVSGFLKKKYPQIQFVISDDYESTFDQL